MAQRVTGQRFRQRKLSTKQNLPVIYENELDVSPDDDATRHIPKVETGVEKGEEVVSSAVPLTPFRHLFITTRDIPIHPLHRPSHLSVPR